MEPSPIPVRDPEDRGASWFAAPDFAPVLERSFLPRRRALEDGAFARSVKRSQHRHVLFVELEGHAVYVKCHRPQGPGKRLLQRVLGDRASNEWRKTHALAALGLATPEPLAHGRSRRAPRRAYYLCRAVAPARTLTAVLGDPATPASERQALLGAVARDLASLHRARMHHRDFHGNNVLVHASGVPHWIDLHSLWRVPWLPPPWRRLPLAKLLASLREELAPSEVEHVLATYEESWGRAADAARRRGFARRVRRDAASIHRTHRDSRIARCLADATLFARRRTLVERRHARRELSADVLRDLLARAERGEGTLLKEAPRTRVVRLDGACGAFVVKTFFSEGLKGLARYRFGRTRAERAWIAARALEVIGVDTPRAHACVSRHGGPDHVVTEFVPGSHSLEELAPGRWADLPAAERRAFCVRLGRALARMHGNDVHHTDLSAKNVLAVATPAGLAPWFVDLEAVKLRRTVRDADRVRALGQLNDVPRGRVSRTARMRVLRAYGEALGAPLGRRLLARIDAWTRSRVQRRETRWRSEGRDVRESAYYEAAGEPS